MSEPKTPVIPESHTPAPIYPYTHQAFSSLIDALTAVYRMCEVLGMNPNGSTDQRDRAGIGEFCRSAADRLTIDRAACVALGSTIMRHTANAKPSTEQQLFELGAQARRVAERSNAHNAVFMTELDLAARPAGPKWRTCSNCHSLNDPDTELCDNCQTYLPEDEDEKR